jgi:clan AA aspartic protease (TIGR02281 family)
MDEPEAPPLPQALPQPVPDDEYYSYTDAKGVIRLGNRPRQVTSDGNSTPVIIRGNQVLVPVTLAYRGRSVNATLLLDTGATVTTINERCAAALGVEPGETETSSSTVADGRRVSSSMFVTDSILVGPSRIANVRTSILPGSGGAGHDGLLGMDFLKNFRYHIDFSRNRIDWG